MAFMVEVWGKYALFTRPEMKVERVSYDVMTPSAARGLLEAIYWHPGIRWVIDKIYVLSPIRFTNIRRNEVSAKMSAIKSRSVMTGGNGDLYLSTQECIQQRAAMLLEDVHYIIEAHFDITENASPEDNPGKITDIVHRRLKKGQCYIELKKWILTTIGDYSFHNCRSLQAFLIADSVNYVGEEAFTGTSSSFKAQCRWKSDLWTYVSNLGYDVEEAPYKISYSNLNPEMKHSLEYCIDHSTQGYYNKEMNYICAILAFSGYEKSTVRQNLRAMGFANSDIYQDYEYSSGDHVGYTIAYRQINDDEGIAVVVLRGSHGSIPFSPDWISNLANVGNGDRHAGFNAAANEVYAAMKNKIPMSDSHIKYVITGHSRGAAVGNLVEANIIRDYRAASRVYGYNYACPNTVTHGKYNSISCPNVFNFWNTNDIVPYVPASDTPVRTLDVKTSLEYMLTAAFTDQDEWKKYGKNLYFTRGVDLLAWATNIGQWDNNFWTELKQNFIDNHMKCYYQFATDVYYNGYVYRNQP